MADIAWAAGFLEGEGSFYYPNYTVTVRAEQVCRDPLDKLSALFGGPVSLRRHPSRKNVQPIHGWWIHGKKAAGLMMTVYPLMSGKRKEQIRAALAKWRVIPVGVRSKFSPVCKRGHRRWGSFIYTAKPSGERRRSRRCLECHRQRRAGLLGVS